MNWSISTLRYRVYQFFTALTARVSDEELEQIAYILTPSSLALFRSMAIQDQRHGLDVCAELQRADHTHRDLLAAALLHDVGKAAAQIPAWQRAVVVLLNRLAPRLLVYLGQTDHPYRVPGRSEKRISSPPQGKVPGLPRGEIPGLPRGWRRAFAVNTRHAEIGARWAEETGCSHLTVALIRRHQDGPADGFASIGEENRLLALLQAADNSN